MASQALRPSITIPYSGKNNRRLSIWLKMAKTCTFLSCQKITRLFAYIYQQIFNLSDMKPSLRKAVPLAESSFVVRRDVGSAMRNNWHYHPEYELIYIKRSIGTWLIGDYVGQHKSGDILLIGPNLPHSIRHENKYIIGKENRSGEAIVAIFRQELFGKSFMDLPEMRGIKQTLQVAKRGIKLTGKTRNEVSRIMEKIQLGSPGSRLIDLLSILQTISNGLDYEILASSGYSYHSDGIDNARISAIFEYTFNNFQNQISIDDVASLVNMSKHSFCRYFKEKTKKTYIQFLMEIKIGNACRLLIEEDMTVAQVCYACGYNTISHFNHQFKAIKNKSPYEFKQDYLSRLSAL
jgi:AraC-like DNA-binding protein